jgi:hypothetical protein
VPRGRYLPDEPRVYPLIPLTATQGGVWDWTDGLPDNRWEDAGDAEVTLVPDNAPVSEAPVTEPPSEPPPVPEPPALPDPETIPADAPATTPPSSEAS